MDATPECSAAISLDIGPFDWLTTAFRRLTTAFLPMPVQDYAVVVHIEMTQPAHVLQNHCVFAHRSFKVSPKDDKLLFTTTFYI